VSICLLLAHAASVLHGETARPTFKSGLIDIYPFFVQMPRNAGPRSAEVTPYIGQLSRSALYRKKALYKRTHKATPSAAPVDTANETKEVKVNGANNGQKRTVPANKAPRFYPAEDIRQKKVTRKTNRPARLRSSITPGTVLILLAGKFRGKRVVFLKQLSSGLLLVSGPAKINGVPLRRVNQAYVIATSTKIDISGVKASSRPLFTVSRSWPDWRIQVDSKFDDAYFKRAGSVRTRGTESEFFKEADKKATETKSGRAGDYKDLDKALVAEVAKVPNLAKYLASTFALSNGQKPHLLNF
jgi:large subunit ribosomal protein L6e